MKFLSVLFLIQLMLIPAFAQNYNEFMSSDKGTLDIGITTIPEKPIAGGVTKFQIDFINPKTEKIQEHIDYKFTLQRDGKNVFGPTDLIHTSEGSVTIPVETIESGTYFGLVEIEGILFQPIPVEAASFSISILGNQPPNNGNSGDGGCLIATATFGSELSPKVQQLRELRDDVVLKTESGKLFMNSFNEFYYSFSPAIADFERQNDFFREGVKIAIVPLLTSLSILTYVDIDSETEMLGYGISLILLNLGMYFGIPAVIITKIKQSLKE
ncbi:MAG TPA: CFI-box-CTERM domain-containing protein [Nitrosopumilaceae archaeon]|nr:CFI-box-CTERM domain-containing protein [Nitrosopumilaceae archaeon]